MKQVKFLNEVDPFIYKIANALYMGSVIPIMGKKV